MWFDSYNNVRISYFFSSCKLLIRKGGTPSPNPTLGNQGACSNIFKPTTTTFYYGSSTQLWGFSSWLPSDLSNIQVVFQGQPQKSPASFYIQAIQLAVYYTSMNALLIFLLKIQY